MANATARDKLDVYNVLLKTCFKWGLPLVIIKSGYKVLLKACFEMIVLVMPVKLLLRRESPPADLRQRLQPLIPMLDYHSQYKSKDGNVIEYLMGGAMYVHTLPFFLYVYHICA